MRITCSDMQIVTINKFQYYQMQGRIVPNQENKAPLLSIERKKNISVNDRIIQKPEINKSDKKGINIKNQRLTDVQTEARKRAMQLLQRAFNMKLEQEEEIQRCNRFILETKCRAVRDAQIAEKNIIKRELMKETQHLNDMMENERRLSIKAEAEKEEANIIKRKKFAEALKKQIFENEEHRLMEIRKKQEESRSINSIKIAWQKDEIFKLKSQKDKIAKVRKSLSESKNQLKYFKDIESEENKIMDKRLERQSQKQSRRIQEFQRKRQERDDKIAAEQRLKKLKKEQEQECAAFKVQSALNIQVQIEEINAARIQEAVEREWRRKEKEEALRATQNETILRISREEQIKEKRIMQALEIKRDKEEFKKIIEFQNQAEKRDAKEKERKYKEALHHRSEVLKQVNDKERLRFLTRQKIVQDSLIMQKESKMRKYKLLEAMERKCEEMRKNKGPLPYILEVTHMIENVK